MRDTRIQKAMADQGLCSRRAAEQIIQEGRVKLNGRPVQLGDKMDIRADILSVDGENIVFNRKKEYYYYMLNKPRGYITTSSDDRGRKTVLDLVKEFLPNAISTKAKLSPLLKKKQTLLQQWKKNTAIFMQYCATVLFSICQSKTAAAHCSAGILS